MRGSQLQSTQPPRYLYNQRPIRLHPPCWGSRGAQGSGRALGATLVLESRLCSGFPAGRAMRIWVGDLVGTNAFSAEEELPWRHGEPVKAPGRPELCPDAWHSLNTMGTRKKHPKKAKTKTPSAFMLTLRLGSRAGVPAEPGRCLAQPLGWMLPPPRRLRAGMEPSAPVSQQDPLNTSPAGSTPPDGTGSFWQAPSACYNLSSLTGRILSSLLMFYAAWLHLQRKNSHCSQ